MKRVVADTRTLKRYTAFRNNQLLLGYRRTSGLLWCAFRCNSPPCASRNRQRAEVRRASDTPPLVALADVSNAPKTVTRTRRGVSDRSAQRPVSEVTEQAECPTESGPRAPARPGHLFSGAAAFFASGYVARSSRHFFASSGLPSAVYSATSRSRAWTTRGASRGSSAFSHGFSPS